MRARYDAVVPTPRYFLDLISCRSGCPVRTNAGAYARAVAEGDYQKGYDIASGSNPWVSSCAHTCARPCESHCRRGTIDQPISIRALKRTLTEHYTQEGSAPGVRPSDVVPLDVAARVDGRPARVAVVGAGPAGLACAHDLAFLGYRVTVFEASPVVGGMLFQGVPEYRLPRGVIRVDVERIVQMGVEIKTRRRLGEDFTVTDLRRDAYAAVFLALGAMRGRELEIPGADMDGVVNGVDFLLNANLGYHVAVGTHVLVVGGGSVALDVARTALRYEPTGHKMPPAAEALRESGSHRTSIDAARTALRLGALRVTVVSLETRHEMPASPEDIVEAEEEGIRFIHGHAPHRFLGEDGRLTALETIDVVSTVDEKGRLAFTAVPGSERTIACDTAILAIGQKPDATVLERDTDIALTPNGFVQVDPTTLATTMPAVYCGGDLAFGPRNMIEAAGDGKRAALAIHRDLGGRAVTRAPLRFRRIRLDRGQEHYDRISRQTVPVLPVERRSGFREVELGYPDTQARLEGQRCLWCNVSPIFDSEKCILCGGCMDICPENCLKLVRVDRIAGVPHLDALRTSTGATTAGGAILKDEDRCIRCGLCVERCPTGAVTMELLDVDDSPAAALQLFAEEMNLTP